MDVGDGDLEQQLGEVKDEISRGSGYRQQRLQAPLGEEEVMGKKGYHRRAGDPEGQMERVKKPGKNHPEGKEEDKSD